MSSSKNKLCRGCRLLKSLQNPSIHRKLGLSLGKLWSFFDHLMLVCIQNYLRFALTAE